MMSSSNPPLPCPLAVSLCATSPRFLNTSRDSASLLMVLSQEEWLTHMRAVCPPPFNKTWADWRVGQAGISKILENLLFPFVLNFEVSEILYILLNSCMMPIDMGIYKRSI